MLQKAIARAPRWALVAGVLAVVSAGLAALAVFGAAVLPARTGPPVEELTVERTVLHPGTIELTVRNTGPDPVTVAQVTVDDSFVDVAGGTEPIDRLGTATLRLDYPWQDGMPYRVGLLTSTGLVIEHEIPVAVATPAVDAPSLGRMALLGALIGIVPVLLGMTALPVLRRAGPTATRVLLAFTVGLLGFLAVDAAIDGSDLAAATGGAFGGVALVALGAALAFLALAAVDRIPRRGATGPHLALLIAIGIGLHNLGEGLAVGSAFAVGELALGTALLVGFAVHNTTEGIAVVAPLTGQRATPSRLLGLGLVAGAPAMLGTVLGATVTTPAQAAFLLGLGIGAIAQVAVQITPLLRGAAGRSLDAPVIGGLAGGALVMYLTGLLVAG
ncbi:ZIP family metal transporter [Pseudonocardia asaccharolytica]|uniref:Metal transporter n=1 Tax=Pseudonocardia asaccharolytica DSM 44247 = NBRC 16224 TaxID=1123024 RepID=A0A511CYH4_9PSEU|nr:metal transporter [Pseudonocardia asaccharolytica]GEL17303.1 metal transporter [Pseudonocardia asaccharolytica DSM 44247 = NBRC 16224]